MEATGCYWLALAMRLHEHPRLVVCVHNPALINRFIQSFGGRTKTDAIDAILIARFARERARIAWVAPGATRAKLCALARAYEDYTVSVRPGASVEPLRFKSGQTKTTSRNGCRFSFPSTGPQAAFQLDGSNASRSSRVVMPGNLVSMSRRYS